MFAEDKKDLLVISDEGLKTRAPKGYFLRTQLRAILEGGRSQRR
jgi:hypothetical protein